MKPILAIPCKVSGGPKKFENLCFSDYFLFYKVRYKSDLRGRIFTILPYFGTDVSVKKNINSTYDRSGGVNDKKLRTMSNLNVNVHKIDNLISYAPSLI